MKVLLIPKKVMSQSGIFWAYPELQIFIIFRDNGGGSLLIFAVEWGRPKDHNHSQDNI